MQWLIGALRLGALANFISPSALRGFTSGAAALIAVHSLTDLFGLPAPASHGTGALLGPPGRSSWRDVGAGRCAGRRWHDRDAVLVVRRVLAALRRTC